MRQGEEELGRTEKVLAKPKARERNLELRNIG